VRPIKPANDFLFWCSKIQSQGAKSSVVAAKPGARCKADTQPKSVDNHVISHGVMPGRRGDSRAAGGANQWKSDPADAALFLCRRFLGLVFHRGGWRRILRR
jgi:hypothetical protein